MLQLAIDTSCDETSIAVAREGNLLSSVVSSQVRFHKKFGGVVPFLAQRLHKERIDAVIELALQRAGVKIEEIEGISVTYGPGLAPALEVGIETAKKLAKTGNVPLYPVDHMAGHIASCFINQKSPQFPALAVLVSGGHSELVLVKKWGEFEILGQTLDDALGEAYDKTAKMLGLGYPGGKLLAKLAAKGNSAAYELPVPMLRSQDYNLSYSGLKNAVRLLIAEVKNGREILDSTEIEDIAATFERVAQEGLLRKVEKILKEYPEIKSVLLAGGVAANTVLRRKMRKIAKDFGCILLMPQKLAYCGDNAAMIAMAAWLNKEAGLTPLTGEEVDGLERVPSLTLEQSFTK